jgi:plastocyanin domain-containing protein
VALLAAAAIGWICWYFLVTPRRAVGMLATLTGGVQSLAIRVTGAYDPAVIRVRVGVPARLTFTRTDTSSCTEEVVLGDFNIRTFLPTGTPTPVEFTPRTPGRYDFHCGMGMVHGTLIVEEEGER